MTTMFWFLLGLWVGCSAGVLLVGCMFVARDGAQRADAALHRLYRADRRIGRHDRRVGIDLLRIKRATQTPRASREQLAYPRT